MRIAICPARAARYVTKVARTTENCDKLDHVFHRNTAAHVLLLVYYPSLNQWHAPRGHG
jgi:hypothetical protein